MRAISSAVRLLVVHCFDFLAEEGGHRLGEDQGMRGMQCIILGVIWLFFVGDLLVYFFYEVLA